MKELLTEKSWKELLDFEMERNYFKDLSQFVKEEQKKAVVYPPSKEIFAAFNASAFSDIEVVILGQDPYHGPGQANGFCFSVSDGVKIPPSLNNIFKELNADQDCASPITGNLERWANQGVFLLNATLTVRKDSPGSHQNKGWEAFTDHVIKLISEEKENVVFMLWGNYAKAKSILIDEKKHLILEAAHPSPLARGAFFGCRHFSKANEYLKSKGKKEIDWCL